LKRIPIFLAFAVASPLFALDATLETPLHDAACGDVALQMTSDDAITRSVVVFPHARYDLKPQQLSNEYDFSVKVPDGGITYVSVDLAPRTRELAPRQVEKYLDAIAANDAVRTAWKAHPERWREQRTQHAKTLLRCGGDKRGGFQTSTGSGAEFVPQGTDPTTLKTGDTFRVILIRQAQKTTLVRDTAFVLLRDDGSRVLTVKPPESGVASFVIPEPGRYVLTATEVRPGDGKDVDWVSDYTTLSFTVE
jgi:hypothetical protein